MNTIRQLFQYALKELNCSYPDREIHNICEIIFMDLFHLTKIDILIRKNEHLDESFSNKFTEIITLLKSGIPLQYVLGETEFGGLKFKVNPSTLIPRPETRELVKWAGSSLHGTEKVLDIGTGSGCIAITLAHEHPDLSVTAIDISAEAIATATENAMLNKVAVEFLQRDILRPDIYDWSSYDLIVSNPPYVRESEKQWMQPHVLNHEPHRALFVPDENPLLFYKSIAAFGQQRLAPEGWLYLEINEAFGNEVASLLSSSGYAGVEIKKDMCAKDRMIRGRRSQS